MLLHLCARLAPTRPIAVAASVQENRGQLKDLFAPKIRLTTLLLSFLWLGPFCQSSHVILIRTRPNLSIQPKVCKYFLLLWYCHVDAQPGAVWRFLHG